MQVRRLSVILTITIICTGCGYFAARDLAGVEVPVPADFSFVGEKSPCYLELRKGTEALRVNCFHINGTLHIHTSRWAKLPRFSGESWTDTVRRTPNVRIEIAKKIYSLVATPINDESYRKKILYDRGYWHAWNAITIFRFTSTQT